MHWHHKNGSGIWDIWLWQTIRNENPDFLIWKSLLGNWIRIDNVLSLIMVQFGIGNSFNGTLLTSLILLPRGRLFVYVGRHIQVLVRWCTDWCIHVSHPSSSAKYKREGRCKCILHYRSQKAAAMADSGGNPAQRGWNVECASHNTCMPTLHHHRRRRLRHSGTFSMCIVDRWGAA